MKKSSEFSSEWIILYVSINNNKRILNKPNYMYFNKCVGGYIMRWHSYEF